MSAGDADTEFAALEAGEPVRDPHADKELPKVSDRSVDKDIEPNVSDGGNDQSTYDIVEPQVHELNAHLLFSPFQTEPDVDGMRPYFAIVSAFEPDLNIEFDALGTTWSIDHRDDYADEEDPDSVLQYWDGSIATRDRDSGDHFLEYQIPIYDTADPKRNRRINFQFRPALPNAKHADTGDDIYSLPDDLPEGVRVQVQSSNVDPEHVVELLQELANAIGINSHYFNRDHIYKWSRITGLAFYVRCQRDVVNDQVIGADGLFERLAQFERQREGRGEMKWDNQDAFGKRHAVALDSVQLDHLYEPHVVGKLAKSYLKKNPTKAANVSEPTDHPKIEVQYNREYSNFEGHLPWFEAHAADGDGTIGWRTLADRLQGYLINILEWAELPRTPGHDVFVSDDHFDADDRIDQNVADRLELVPDPIDTVVDAERSVVTGELLSDPPTDGEKAVLRTAADGGAFESLEALADEAGVSSSTVSRCIQKFSTLFSRLGNIQLADEVVRDRVQELFAAIEAQIDRAQTGLDHLSSGSTNVDEDSALGQWAQRWGVKIAEAGYRRSEQLRLAIVGGNLTERELLEVLRAGYDAADLTQSVDVNRFATAEVTYYDRDGEKVDAGEWVGVNQGGRTKLLGKMEVNALH